MWSIIRRTQGIPLNESNFENLSTEERQERNHRCILMHERKPYVPFIDPKVYTKAYGRGNFEKIRRWMLDEDPRLRVQGVEELIALYIEQRENAVLSLSYDAFPSLVAMMCSDEDSHIRERAATALEILIREPRAQQLMLNTPEVNGVPPLERLLGAINDPCDGVIILALRVMVACHAYHNLFALTEALVDLGSIPTLLELVQRENVVVRAVACSALVPTFDVKEAFIIFLQHGGVRIVTEALAVDDAMLIAEAAEVVSRAAEFPQGKRDVVECGTIPALLPYLGHENLSVRVAVAAAVAQSTILETAKFQSLEIGITEPILELVAVEDERDVLIHLARIIYNIAEHPQGRALLRPSKERLELLMGLAQEDEAILKALTTTVELLERK